MSTLVPSSAATIVFGPLPSTVALFVLAPRDIYIYIYIFTYLEITRIEFTVCEALHDLASGTLLFQDALRNLALDQMNT